MTKSPLALKKLGCHLGLLGHQRVLCQGRAPLVGTRAAPVPGTIPDLAGPRQPSARQDRGGTVKMRVGVVPTPQPARLGYAQRGFNPGLPSSRPAPLSPTSWPPRAVRSRRRTEQCGWEGGKSRLGPREIPSQSP